MVGTFMLLFNLTVSGPSGAAGDEIINVYSKRFDTKIKCEQFLDDYEWLIRSKGVSSFQDMLKKGYKVKLNSVTCNIPGGAANVSKTFTHNIGRG